MDKPKHAKAMFRLELALRDAVAALPFVAPARRTLLQRLGFGTYPTVRIRRTLRGSLIIEVRAVVRQGAPAIERGQAIRDAAGAVMEHHPAHRHWRLHIVIAGLAPAAAG